MIHDKGNFVNTKNKQLTYYAQYCKIKVINGQVTAVSKDSEDVIPVAIYASIIMGPGTSVTAEAAKAIFKRDCVLIFAGGGGLPAFGQTGNYRNPIHKLRQYKTILKNPTRIAAAKKLLLARNDILESIGFPLISQTQIQSQDCIEDLLLVEARWQRGCFAYLKQKYGFERPKEKLKLLNHFAYSAVLPPILGMALDPNIGILHGRNRGGGLVFDIADVFKPVLSLKIAYETADNASPNELKADFIKTCNQIKLSKQSICLLEGLYF